MLAVGAGGRYLLSSLFAFYLSVGYGPIQIEIRSQMAVKVKTTNQPSIRLAKGPCS